jgi:hypothetical protein
MTAGTALTPTVARREIYLDRRVCSISPNRIEIHPARSIIFLPLLTLALGLGAFPLIYFAGGSLSLELRFGLTLVALLLVPLSGLGLVYSIAGAHVVVDRAKQSTVLQQGYLGMGVGTQELIPFWKVERVQVQELTPHDYRGHQDDFAQYEVVILKVSGKQVPIGTVTVVRAEAKEGLARARAIANAVAEMADSHVYVARSRPAKDASRVAAS